MPIEFTHCRYLPLRPLDPSRPNAYRAGAGLDHLHPHGALVLERERRQRDKATTIWSGTAEIFLISGQLLASQEPRDAHCCVCEGALGRPAGADETRFYWRPF